MNALAFQVGRSVPKPDGIVRHHADTAVAVATEKSTPSIGAVAMVEFQSPTKRFFGAIADGARAALIMKKSIPLCPRDAVIGDEPSLTPLVAMLRILHPLVGVEFLRARCMAFAAPETVASQAGVTSASVDVGAGFAMSGRHEH